MSQAIRPSQFITTYGPGSILEGPKGPVVIPSLNNSGIFNSDDSPEKFEIVDQRFCQSLLKGYRIVRIPSNAELNKPDNMEVYKTKPFPKWSLCVEHGILYRHDTDPYGCPKCRHKSFQKAREEAIRFVLVCENGHLSDVDWINLVPHSSDKCNPTYMYWEGSGSLSSIRIKCPFCKKSVNLGQVYSSQFDCPGYFPETGITEICKGKARIIQRNASNIRIPEILTSLTIPPKSTELHEIFGRKDMKLLLIKQPSNKAELIEILENATDEGLLPKDIINRVDQYNEEIIFKALDEAKQKEKPRNYYEYRLDELNALQLAAKEDESRVQSSTPGAPPRFEVNRAEVREIKASKGNVIRITPVTRLRVIAVQKGYRRMNPVSGNIINCKFENNGDRWLPGVELNGEGIFIDLGIRGNNYEDYHWRMQGDDYEEWMKAYNNFQFYYGGELTDESFCLHPVFVWWHTLSHRLINSLSIDSGYSSAAIRERVYVRIDGEKALGGILLYTVQPGGDGTLGGLTALVSNFEFILENALRNIYVCSNDPLCENEKFKVGHYNGAACYACQLVSETSCEHRNMFLDRNLLKNNLP